MTKKHGCRIYTIIGIAALIAAGIMFTVCAGGSYGHLTLRVADAYSLLPIEGAAVTIADDNKTVYSDESGAAVFYGIRLRKNPLQERIYPQSWGECTIVSSCEGYIPTVILHSHIYKNEMRRAAIYMFPTGSEVENVISIIEAPDKEWLENIAEIK